MSTATINNAIVSDPTDSNAREAPRVSETRATAPDEPGFPAPSGPEFPPGRYGRRRDGRRHLLVPAVILTLVLVVCVLLAVRLYRQYGDPAYDSQIVGWSDVTDTQMRIKFTVNVPAGSTASCTIRARDYNGNEVGRRTVTVRAAGGDTSVQANELVTTSAKASAGDVLQCGPAS
jgi:hypothetical protein